MVFPFSLQADDESAKCMEAWTLLSIGKSDQAYASALKFLETNPEADPLWQALAHRVIANCEWSKGESGNQYVALNELRKAIAQLDKIDADTYKDIKLFRDIYAEGCVMAWKKNAWIDCESMGDSYLALTKEYMDQDKTTFLTIFYFTAKAKQNLRKHEEVLRMVDLAVSVSGDIKEATDERLVLQLLILIGDSMTVLGQTDNAVVIHNLALQLALPVYGQHDLLTLEIEYSLGESLYRNGRLEDALDMFRIYSETPTDVEVAKRYTAAVYCGEIYSTMGRPSEGAAVMERVMKDKSRIKNLSKTDLSNMYLVLYALQKEAGEIEKAHETYDYYLSVAVINPEMYHAKCSRSLDADDIGSARESLDMLKAHYSAIKDTVSSSYADYLNLEFVYCIKTHTVPDPNQIARFVLLRKRNFGKYSEKYSSSLMDAACYHYMYGNRNEVARYIHDYVDVVSEVISTRFISMNKDERDKYWQKVRKPLSVTIPLIASLCNFDSLGIAGYQSALLSKGLLLRAEKSLADIKNESVDISIQKKIDNYLKELDFIYNSTDSDDNAHDVASKIHEISDEFIKISPLIEMLSLRLSIKIENVFRRLKNEDLAVEFVYIPDENKSKNILIAYLLRKDWMAPKVVALMNEDQLTPILDVDYFEKTDLSKAIWGKIMQIGGEGIKNIYFAPDGPLYDIPVEYLPDYDNPNSFVFERLNLYRLSSTGELAMHPNTHDEKRAAVYGGMDYNDRLDNDRHSSNGDLMREVAFDESFLEETGLRGGVSNLPETAVEVNNIAKLMAEAKIDCDKYMGTEASEKNFKLISGSKIPYIHIATHGFYWTPKEYRRFKSLSFFEGIEKTDVEDFALMRSGLLFSGANRVLDVVSIPESMNDGVLTALEISTMDLTNIDMLVLSACETGLGDINSDGVFGLQRGFKKAGVKSLMMSLWKVDDRATQVLMTKFYEHLLKGKSKIESLRLAQKYVREYEEEVVYENPNMSAPQSGEKLKQDIEQDVNTSNLIKIRPFEDPVYWASFILLDALN